MGLISCPDCGNQVSDAAHSCPNCGRPVRRYEPDFSGAELRKQLPIGPSPWRRLIARYLDYLLPLMILGAVGAFVAPYGGYFALPLAFYDRVWALEESIGPLAFMSYVVVWVLLESVFLSLWGTTPGKSLLKIRVEREGGGNPDFLSAFHRSVRVWLFGIGAGAPKIWAMTFLLSWFQLQRDKQTGWDKAAGTVCVSGRR